MQSKRNLAILVINYSGRGGGEGGGVGVLRILEDHMVFTGNRGGISRRQRVWKGSLHKIDCS